MDFLTLAVAALGRTYGFEPQQINEVWDRMRSEAYVAVPSAHIALFERHARDLGYLPALDRERPVFDVDAEVRRMARLRATIDEAKRQ